MIVPHPGGCDSPTILKDDLLREVEDKEETLLKVVPNQQEPEPAEGGRGRRSIERRPTVGQPCPVPFCSSSQRLGNKIHQVLV